MMSSDCLPAPYMNGENYGHIQIRLVTGHEISWRMMNGGQLSSGLLAHGPALQLIGKIY